MATAPCGINSISPTHEMTSLSHYFVLYACTCSAPASVGRPVPVRAPRRYVVLLATAPRPAYCVCHLMNCICTVRKNSFKRKTRWRCTAAHRPRPALGARHTRATAHRAAHRRVRHAPLTHSPHPRVRAPEHASPLSISILRCHAAHAPLTSHNSHSTLHADRPRATRALALSFLATASATCTAHAPPLLNPHAILIPLHNR